MRVEEVMTRDVRSCQASDDLSVAARVMWDQDCGCVPVVDGESRVIGMLTDRDVCMAAYTRGLPLSQMTVESAMSAPVFTSEAGEPLEQAEQNMQRHQVRRLPVIGELGRLVGVLSLSDLARAASRGGRKRNGVQPAVVEATLEAICQPRNGPIL